MAGVGGQDIEQAGIVTEFMSEEAEELKRQLELLEVKHQGEVGLLEQQMTAEVIEKELELAKVNAEMETVRKEATETLQKMLDLEADHAAERAKQAYLHQVTEEAIKCMHQSCIDELTAETKRLKRENLDLEEALKASQNN